MPDIQELIKSSLKLSKDFEYLPFPLLVKATTNYEVIPLNFNSSPEDKRLFNELKDSANNFIDYAARIRQRFQGDRINDVGKRIEEAFVEELKKTELNPILLTKSGYPDIKVVDSSGRITYLESKAVSKDWNSSFRSFYYTDGKKLDSNARHLLIAWDIAEETPKYWKINGWKICDLFNLKMKIKLEFNSNNKELYSDELLLFHR